jgi:hypothetical protein
MLGSLMASIAAETAECFLTQQKNARDYNNIQSQEKAYTNQRMLH